VGILRGLDVVEVDVGKATGPAGGAVDRDADVLDAVEIPEEHVKLSIGGLVGDVSDVKRLGGAVGGGALAALVGAGSLGDLESASVPECAVDVADGLQLSLL